mgnify:CR=1 FL=1
MSDPITIVGSGLAGYTLARELRKLDAKSSLRIVSADDACFYSKPMLSNALAQNKTAEMLVNTPAAAMAQQLNAEILPHTTVHALDTNAHRLRTSGGELSYSRLVLAVGAQPLRAPMAQGADIPLSVNSLADYARFRTALASAHNIAVIGAGLIGCEFANDLAAKGHRVAVIDPSAHPLGRLLPPRVGQALQARLGEIGIEWHLATSVTGIETRANGVSAYRLSLADGGEIVVDLVLSAIGLRAHTALAQAAGIVTQRGIVVDRLLQTSAPDVYALGDCMEIEGLVLPFVLPIMQQARALAKTLSGQPTPLQYPAMPVVVKTPALPLVVNPPPPAVAGTWQIEGDGNDLAARFIDAEGRLHGFALSGAATAKKQELARSLPACLA